MITRSHLSKSFGSLVAVKDLSLEINAGEILGFLSSNGAGKTTILIDRRQALQVNTAQAFKKTLGEGDLLNAGNFPLFLFMFFTGTAFPIQVVPWFTLGGYGINWPTLMSPAPVIQAMTKVSILGQGWGSVLPELSRLVFLSMVFFLLGLLIFQRRHLRSS